MATFTWAVSSEPTRDVSPRVLLSSFGDGYEQRIGDGINTIARKWSVAFNARRTSEADDIDDFLTARGGIESFDWTPPRGAAGKWVCRTWRRDEVSYNLSTITATFEEVFGE